MSSCGVHQGQVEQADAAEAVVQEQQAARVEAVAQPAGRDRADEVEGAHQGERPARRGRREPVIDGVRDEVGADDAVRGRAADEERAREQPELRRADGAAHDPGIGALRERAIGRVLAAGSAPRRRQGSRAGAGRPGSRRARARRPGRAPQRASPRIPRSTIRTGKKISWPALAAPPNSPITTPLPFRTSGWRRSGRARWRRARHRSRSPARRRARVARPR